MENLDVLWHPFTQMKHEKAIQIIRGKGTVLYAANGQRLIDGISSWWVNLHGHAHPYIAEKIAKQASILEHVLFAGFSHKPAHSLAIRLLQMLPFMTKVFYSDNGSTAVEAALKMAIQYWYNLGKPRQKILCLKGGYHGDTFGAMSAAGKNLFNRPFWKHLFEVEAIDPHDAALEEMLQKEPACFIFEPLILGSGGMLIYESSVFSRILKLCQKYGVITIADEVMTGFGRTETLFACEQLQFQPDIICLSKGITGGFLPLGATLCKEFIYQGFYADETEKAFLHGHSYTANPIACASALANLDLLQKQECFNQRKIIEMRHKEFCKKWQTHPSLKRCESLGTILVLEYNSENSYFNPLKRFLYLYFLRNGVLLRPLGNVVYVMPPYCINNDELSLIYHLLTETLHENFIRKNCAK